MPLSPAEIAAIVKLRELEKKPLDLPYNFTPRDYQLPLWNALDNHNRAVVVWHRRAGKDKTFINFQIRKAWETVGNYYYFFPTYTQAKKVIWDGRDKSGFKFMDHFPDEIVKSKNATELKVEMTNGSIWQLIGTDKFDSIRGTNPRGCVFSEYSMQDPEAWEVIRPILRENGGWALFNFTPMGGNHAYALYKMALANPEWFCQLLTIEDTGVLNQEDMDKERAEGATESMIRQEYYCDFNIQQASGLFNPDDIRACMSGAITTTDIDGRPIVGVDVARSAQGDKSIIGHRAGNVVVYDWRERTQDVMVVADEAFKIYNRLDARIINVDAIGIGAGVADRLKQLGANVNAVNVGESPHPRACAEKDKKAPDRFTNLRAQLYWQLKEMIVAREIQLPKCEDLSLQLANTEYEIKAERKIAIEKKDKIKKKIGRSPDEADMVMLTMYEKSVTGFRPVWV